MSVVYTKKSSVITREIAGETLLIPIKGQLANLQQIFALNPVAECIWSSLDGKVTKKQIIDAILTRFETEATKAEDDLEEFLRQLLEADLIERIES